MSSSTTSTKTGYGTSEVLTLPEAAAYLRVPEEVLQRMAAEQAIPARKIGEEWRFLRSALQDWLSRDANRGSDGARLVPLQLLLAEIEDRLLVKLTTRQQPAAEKGSKERLLRLAGAWKDDPAVDEMLEEIYRQRGRPMVEEKE
jgi:excisionase family DNA binding protein